MDFTNRSNQSPAVAPSSHPAATAPSGHSKKNQDNSGKLGRIGVAVAAFVIAILIAAIALIIGTQPNTKESKYVDQNKLQAVFLNTGQVYFGNVKSLNSKYFVLNNIYYLQTANGSTTDTKAAANTSVSLVKLGCELHEPFDQMVINRDQVTFWENLQDNGQVATAVKAFEKQNPNGQKCSDQSSSSSNTSNSVQNAGNSNTPAATPKP
ncbi:MAG: hypothetical protein JWL89_147 [Candidatus Saccharibacteria bacterium]|nr:hypothetical protein [Candidatus Saccharibacteria bacterium]